MGRSKKDREILREAVAFYTTPEYATTKKEILEYFQDKYGAKKGASEAARFVQANSDKPVSYENARRNFEGPRKHEVGATKKWQELGQKLGPINDVYKGGPVTVTITATQQEGKTKYRDRTIKIPTMRGVDATKFMQKPTYGPLWAYYGHDFEKDKGPYKLTVTKVTILIG